MTTTQPDCIIEQWRQSDHEAGFTVQHDVEKFKPFWDTVAITKVHLKQSYKDQLDEEFQYFY